jgi:hypothetical protein
MDIALLLPSFMEQSAKLVGRMLGLRGSKQLLERLRRVYGVGRCGTGGSGHQLGLLCWDSL